MQKPLISAEVDQVQRLRAISDYIRDMPSLPITATKVLEICNKPQASPADVTRVISLDPVLTARVLKLINSTYYSMPMRVNSLVRATIILGLNTVKNLVLSISILGGVGGKKSFKSLEMEDFWNHSLSVGVLAKAVAMLNGIPALEQEEYFVAGLLHDLGKIPLNDRFGDAYAKVIEHSQSQKVSILAAENSILGVNHTATGALIAEKWELGPALKSALNYHHNPRSASKEYRLMVVIVALADLCSNLLTLDKSGDLLKSSHNVKRLSAIIGVDWPALQEIIDEASEQVERAKIFLKAA